MWLLQHHLVIQLHKYINLNLTADSDHLLPDPLASPPEQPAAASAKEPTVKTVPKPASTAKPADVSAEGFVWPAVISCVENEVGFGRRAGAVKNKTREELLSVFTENQRLELIEKVPAVANLEDLRLFVRLAPYFNGNYHVEEMMYHENVRRNLLLQLVDKFRDVLVAHECEDTNVTRYFSKSIKATTGA